MSEPEDRDAALRAKLEALRQAFVAKLPGMLDALESAIAAYRDAGDAAGQGDALKRVNAQAHKIAGTAGTYGLSDIAAPLREMEKAVLRDPAPGAEALAEELERVRGLVRDHRSSGGD